MENKILKYISEEKLIQAGDAVLIGVSGGADSLALLYFLHCFRDRLDISVAAAHLNHSLRGEDADCDADFVAAFCRERNIPLYNKVVDVAALAQKMGCGLEAAGRKARRTFFAALAHSQGFSKIALAHHGDDQAETVLLRLARGTGIAGARGMAPSAALEGADAVVIRPFLCLDKASIYAYCRAHGLAFRTDATNFEAVAARNQLRLSVLPALEAVNTGVREHLCAFATLAGEYEDFLEAETARAAQKWLRVRDGKASLDIVGFSACHPLVQKSLLRRCIFTIKGSLKEVAYNHILSVQRLLLSSRTVWEIDLPGKLRAVRRYDEFWIEPKLAAVAEIFGDYALPKDGTVYLARHGICLKMRTFCANNLKELKNSGEKYFDCGRIKGQLHFRSRQTGDYFYSRGMKGRKKLKDFFIDNKVDRTLRDRIPLLACGSEILWSPGRFLNAAYAPNANTEKILAVCLLPVKAQKNEEK